MDNKNVKVRIITPLCAMSEEMHAETVAEVSHLKLLGLEIDCITLGKGPESIEGHFDEVFCAPFVAIEAIKAQNDGIAAVVIDCMGDPGMMAAREAVSIPVVGAGEAAMHFASMAGNRFSCVTILESVRPIFIAHARAYGLEEKLASVRSIGVPVLEIGEHRDALLSMLYAESLKAIEEDHADTIVLGCTGFLGVADEIQRRLSNVAEYEIPVINPLPMAVLLAAAMIHGKLSHSRHAYGKPNLSKKFVGFDLPRVRDSRGRK